MAHKIFKGSNGLYGIEEARTCALVYEADMTKAEAIAIAAAHNNGAETYEEAKRAGNPGGVMRDE